MHAGAPPRPSFRLLGALALFGAPGAIGASCGGGSAGGAEAAEATLGCPAPVGAIAPEDCDAVARDFSAVSVERALELADKPGGPAGAAAAIRRTGAVADAIRQARVDVCRARNACRLTDAAHAAEDARLGDEMASLVALWDARSFRDEAAVARFTERLEAIAKAAGVPASGAAASAPAPAGEEVPPLVNLSFAELTGRGPAPAGLRIRHEGTRLVAVSEGSEGGEVLRAPLSPAGAGVGGGRALVRVVGGFAPKEPPLLAAGDVLTVRFLARASAASELVVALRSIEDDELGAREGEGHAQVFKLDKGARARHEARLAAPGGASGLYVALGIRGEGAVDLDGVEVLREGSLIAEARAEKNSPAVQTTCAASARSPLEGKRSLACKAGELEALRIGFPVAYATLAVHRAGAAGRPLAALRTASLEGGRTLDVATLDEAELTLSVAGPASLTVERIEVQALRK